MSSVVGRLLLVLACSSTACADGEASSDDNSDENVETGTRSQPSDGESPYAFLRAGGFGYDDTAALWAGLPFDSIGLSRSGCFGSCPVYEVTFTRGGGTGAGSASYEGVAYVEREGSFEGSIDIWYYARLCELVDHFGFVELQENYSAQWTDDETIIVEVRDASGLHRVLDYGHQGPPELVAVQLAIDAITEQIEWK